MESSTTPQTSRNFDFGPYLGTPNQFAGSLAEARLVGSLGHQKAFDDIRDKLNELRRQSAARRKAAKRVLGPYLTVRKGNPSEGRSAKIVIQDGRTLVSTGILAVDGVAPEGHPGALEELGDYIRSNLANETILRDPRSIPTDVVFEQFVLSREPSPSEDGYERKRTTQQARRNKADWLCRFAKKHVPTLDHVEIGFGRDYTDWRLEQSAKVKRKKERRDATIEAEQYMAQQAFDWVKEKLRKARVPLPDLSFEIIQAPKRKKQSLTWMETTWLLAACRGLVRDGMTYKTKIETRHGVERVVWDREDDSRTKWLVRYFITYLATGTRCARNQKLLWGKNSNAGCIDLADNAIWRSGCGEIHHPIKPAGRSTLTPGFAAFAHKWHRRDVKLSSRWGHPPIYVMHGGDGAPIKNLEALVHLVFKRAGLESSSHIMKHTCVTLHALFGYTESQISKIVDTQAKTLRVSYFWLPWIENEDVCETSGKASLQRLSQLKTRSPQPLPSDVIEVAKKSRGKP